MLTLIIGYLLGIVTYPWVSPYLLPLIDKVKSMFNKTDSK